MRNNERVIVALDVETAALAVEMAKTIAPIFPFFKIGIKLFTQAGPSLVRDVLEHGRVFLDLKFYDIPSVVADAVQQAAQLGVSLVTLHASGGKEMMRLCADRIRSLHDRPQLLGVTVLTSFIGLAEFGITLPVWMQVQALAGLARSAEMDGIVCSPAELELLRPQFPSPFLMVTPGIRGAEDAKDDQKRTASPVQAVRAGADYLVIGRPIITASDPVAAAQRIAESLAE